MSERADLSRSPAIETALKRALDAAEADRQAMDAIDLYSCFPCAVLLAAEVLGLDPAARPLTVTGGLPFFGGPGNAYSLHAIAEMVARLRGRPGGRGLVLANGGYLSKETVGIYAADPPPEWRPVVRASAEATSFQLTLPAGEAVVETYTVPWRKGAPSSAILFARTTDGRRIVTQSRDPASIASFLDTDPIGRTIRFEDGEPIRWTLC